MRRPLRRHLATWALAVVAGLQLGANGYTEYEVKATYLYRLPSFFEWPASAWPAEGEALNTCILGRDPFGETLSFFEGRALRKRRFRVHRVADVTSSAKCHIVFVSKRDERRTRDVIAQLSGRAVLTVGEGREFALWGGNVAFVIDQERVRLAVNESSSRRAGLTVSSKLLEFAGVVKEAP